MGEDVGLVACADRYQRDDGGTGRLHQFEIGRAGVRFPRETMRRWACEGRIARSDTADVGSLMRARCALMFQQESRRRETTDAWNSFGIDISGPRWRTRSDTELHHYLHSGADRGGRVGRINFVFSYLALVALLHTPGCAERFGQRSLDGEILLPLMTVGLLAFVVAYFWRNREGVTRRMEALDATVFELASFRITYGMYVAYTMMLLAEFSFGTCTAMAILHYSAVAKACQAAASAPSTPSLTIPHPK